MRSATEVLDSSPKETHGDFRAEVEKLDLYSESPYDGFVVTWGEGAGVDGHEDSVEGRLGAVCRTLVTAVLLGDAHACSALYSRCHDNQMKRCGEVYHIEVTGENGSDDAGKIRSFSRRRCRARPCQIQAI